MIPEFNLYEEYWKIYTKSDTIEPLYVSPEGHSERSIIGEGTENYGYVQNSVIGSNVKIGKGAKVTNSVVMPFTTIEENAVVDHAIVAQNCIISAGAQVVGEMGNIAVVPEGKTVESQADNSQQVS